MTIQEKEGPIIQKKTGKIKFRRDKDGNLYAVKNGETIGKIETSALGNEEERTKWQR